MPVRRRGSTGGSGAGAGAGGFDRKNIKDQILLDCPEVYFRFDEESGTVALDQSGFGRNGTYGSSVQLGKDPISTAVRSAYNPKLSFSYPVATRRDPYNNVSTKQDFSAVCLFKLLPETNCGVLFNAGSSSSGVLLGKGADGNPGSNGNVVVGLANYEAYLNGNTQFQAGVNLLAITARARDNFIVFYLNGLPVYSITQNFRALAGTGTVGFTDNEAFPHALAVYGEFALFYGELSPNRINAYWKSVQLQLL